MKAVVAMDSFKGSLTSLEAGEAVREGILRAMLDARVTVRPLADGGEGTVEALTAGMGGRRERVMVTGPIGRPVEAVYGILDGGRTAVMEMSAAAGLTLVPAGKRDPLRATTYGVGEMIRDAIGKGCRRLIVGIGGSATNDGGAGMLQALGFSLLDRAGRQVEPGARGLAELAEIRDEGALPELRECSFRVACDVTNPLCGERGASAVYGPQKGAGPAVIAQMDRWLADYAALCRRKYPRADPDRPGTGAAGGLGFAFLAFTDARLEPGAEIVLAETGLESYVREADVLVTGEGRLDGQSAMHGQGPRRRGEGRQAVRQADGRLLRVRGRGGGGLQPPGDRCLLPHPPGAGFPGGGHGPGDGPAEPGRRGRTGVPAAGWREGVEMRELPPFL